MRRQIQLLLVIFSLLTCNSFFAQTNGAVGQNIPISTGQLPQRGCATQVPSQQWEAQFQQLIAQYLQQNPQQAKAIANSSSVMSGYSIPVIMHVIHGGVAVGTFPNLLQGQLNSQVTVLDNDYSGIGQNTGNYPATAFATYATNAAVLASSKDASGRIAIANCNINFCLATKDTLGNILTEPGIHRVDFNTLPALTGTFTSKNPTATAYNTSAKFMGFIDGYIKKNTIWNVSKYLNIWVTDQPSGLGLLGYATFPTLSTLTGIPGATGSATTDGFWSWSASFGSSTLFPGGTYSAPYDKGRTCTHEIGHWLGLRHIWGDGTCLTDYCTDTPPATAANFGAPTYPLNANSCASSSPPTGPNGQMFMNFMDYTDDLAMYMFTSDQRTRAHVAMSNSPYRKFLGTHGLCNLPAPIANFTVAPNPVCNGAVLNIGDLSLNIPTSWSYTMAGGTPSLATVQNPTVSYANAGIYTITLVASNAAGASAPVTQTVSVISGPAFALSSNPSATVCAGNNVTITPSGATTYTLLNNSSTSPPFIVTPTVATIYSVSAITSGTNTCKRTQTLSISIGSIAININPPSASVCIGQSVSLFGSGATTYTWNTGINTSSISVSPTVTTTYTLNGTGGGCSGTKTVQVTLNPSPTITVNNATICPAGTATLTANGANTYSWSTGATTSVITVSPASNTTYTVYGTNSLGCSTTKTVSVTIGSGLTLGATASPATICAGSPSTLSATGATTYTWNPGALTGANIVVTPTVTTTYTVNGASGTCTGSQTVTLLVNGNPTLTATATSPSVCAGSGTNLNATGATSYTWNPGNFVGATYSVTPGSTTTYTVLGTNASGCSSTKTVSVFVVSLPVINVSASPTAVCSGGSSTLSATGATSYTWSGGGTGPSKTVTPTGTTVYTVTGTSGICNGSNTISVIVNPTPTVSVNNATICPSGTATLIASGANTYSWSTGATTSVITVSPPTNTTYTVTGNSLGCTNTKTVSVTIGSAISINISASPSTSICSGNSVTLTATGATSYTWNTGPTANSIVVSPTSNTTYSVNGTNGSCLGSATIAINVNTTTTIFANAGPNQTLCVSSPSTNMAANTPTAGTGTWSFLVGSGVIANVNQPNTAVTGLGTGTNIMQWSIVNGACAFNSSVVYIYVNPLPTAAAAGPSQTICSTSANLSGNTPAVGTGNWVLVSGAGTIANASSPTSGVTGLGVGANIFQWTISNSPCASSSSTVSIVYSNTVVVTASTSASLICTGTQATLTASGAGTFSWSTGANTAVIVVSPSVTTTYTVNSTNGCSASAIITQSVSTCTGINQLVSTAYDVIVYPNPFKEELTVNANELVTAQVYNTLGQLIIVKTINGVGAINTSELAKGVYYLNVKGISGSKTLKIVRE